MIHLSFLLSFVSFIYFSLSLLFNFNGNAIGSEALKITDYQQTAISGAEIFFGLHPNEMFPGRTFITNELGEVLPPEEWSTPLPITIHSTDHILTTYMDVLPHHRQALQVGRGNQRELTPINGEVRGYGPIQNGDQKVDLSVVLPTLSRRDLLAFNISSLISLKMDHLKLPIGKPVPIPSNISIPPQRESYGFASFPWTSPAINFPFY